MYGSQPYGSAAYGSVGTAEAEVSLPAPSGGSSTRFLMLGLRVALLVLLPWSL
jgi:hypothetical protein